jgi:hypothetical protein
MAIRDWVRLVKEAGPSLPGEKGAFIKVFTVDVGTVASVGANTTGEADFTVAGLDTGDTIIGVEKPTHQAGLGIVNARIKAANTLSITYMNTTGSGIVPTDENYKVTVLRINL